MRRSRHHTQKTDVHGKIADAVSISERPATIEDRAVPGHWEGDLVFGSGSSQIATLVERQTRYVMLVKVAGKDTQTVVNALVLNCRQIGSHGRPRASKGLHKQLSHLLQQQPEHAA
jgi:IS30 family transposase